MTTTFNFEYLGNNYRTNADASVTERLDGRKWNRTYSLGVMSAAKKRLGLLPAAYGMEFSVTLCRPGQNEVTTCFAHSEREGFHQLCDSYAEQGFQFRVEFK